MRRLLVPILILGCLAMLVIACYRSVLFDGRQFGYRDAASYYYPLYWRVQAEWQAGRWPLWEPGENAGVPLLGNPTAAVLYPGKMIYAVLPYAWGARIYVVAHTILAVAGMLALLRTLGASWEASALAALGYAFGAPVLFQNCNVIYLVGAAWTPLGFRGADRWLRGGRRWGLIELSLVLTMLTLGGDPESAYVLGICAGGYALGLAWMQSRADVPRPGRGRRRLAAGLLALAFAFAWVVVTLEAAQRYPALRATYQPWTRWVPVAAWVAWGMAAAVVLALWCRRGRQGPLGTMLLGLAGAAGLAALLSAAQLLPVLEYIAQTGRAAGDQNHDIYPFSLEPIRLVELAWPNVFGTHFAGNRSWLEATRPSWMVARFWVPSLYMGGLTMVLAFGALTFRDRAPGRIWLSAVALVSLFASLGEYTGPLFWARCDSAWAQQVGPHDPPFPPTIRVDGKLRDGDGSFYWLLATTLPGFRWFRFPSKLLSFTAMAVAGLAGLGWDRMRSGPTRRRTATLAAALLAIGLAGLATATLGHTAIVAALGDSTAAKVHMPFGPFEPEGAFEELRRALVHGSIVLAMALLLILKGWERPVLAGTLALVLTTADLAVANARLVLTIPQSILDARPRAVAVIEDAERAAVRRGGAQAGPFRVHRLPTWYPSDWERVPSHDRVSESVAWGCDTLEAKYGLMHGIQYTLALGVAEIYDYEWFFGALVRRVDGPMAKLLSLEPNSPVIVFPRRSLDLWNSRYFIIPAAPNGWDDESRGYASFLTASERIYPAPDSFHGPGGKERSQRFAEREDFQIFRNAAAYPRAWVVHDVRFLKPIVGLERADRVVPFEEIIYSAEPLWRDSRRTVYDPRLLAWLDADRMHELAEFLSGNAPVAAESPTITSYGPQAVEIDVTMAEPGLVILADLYYPGWRLAIDGVRAPIYRANRMMRAAAVKAGKHHLSFTYQPGSFRAGLALSVAGLALLAALGIAFWIWPGQPRKRSEGLPTDGDRRERGPAGHALDQLG